MPPETATAPDVGTPIRAEDLGRNDQGQTVFDATFHRTGTLAPLPPDSPERADGEDADQYRYELSFSSEEPYKRWYGVEILGHKKSEVDLDWLKGGTAPLLLQHDHHSQIGVIEKAWLRDGRGKAIVRFGKSPLAEQIRADVLDRIRSNVSVGYRVVEMVLEQQSEDGPDVYRVTDWEPLENSIVSVPADKTVGVGRADETPVAPASPPAAAPSTERTETMPPEATAAPPAEAGNDTPPPADPNAVKNALTQERTRISEITAIGKKLNMQEEAEKAIADGMDLEAFRKVVVEKFSNNYTPPVSPEDAHIGMNKKEIKRYSFLRAIRAQCPWEKGLDAGFELECSRAVAEKVGKEPKGFFVPIDVQQARGEEIYNRSTVQSMRQALAQMILGRDLQIGGGGTASYLVQTDVLAGSFIEVLRARQALTELGIQTLTGLQGDISIPKQTAAGTAYWVTEGNAPTESQQTLAQVTGTPKTVGAFTDITRKTLLQSSLDVEMFVRNDLAAILALAIDAAGFVGTGASGQPTGLTGLSSINNPSVTQGTPTYAEVLGFLENIMTANADIGAMAWAMTAEVMVKLAQTVQHATASTEGFVLSLTNKNCLGYPYIPTNQVGANSLFFGVWNQLVQLLWSATDITVDPYAASTSGSVRVIALQDVDFACRNDEAFAYNDAVTS